jgi:hypothetical protein
LRFAQTPPAIFSPPHPVFPRSTRSRLSRPKSFSCLCFFFLRFLLSFGWIRIPVFHDFEWKTWFFDYMISSFVSAHMPSIVLSLSILLRKLFFAKFLLIKQPCKIFLGGGGIIKVVRIINFNLLKYERKI